MHIRSATIADAAEVARLIGELRAAEILREQEGVYFERHLGE